jgi:AcrR family transcriptional regulator
MLQQSLQKLLETKQFSAISVQDIAEQATVNRATFYDHYPDKARLLECMVAVRFEQMLVERGVTYTASCGEALKGIALSVCDYLAGLPGGNASRIDPHLESAVIAVLRNMLLAGGTAHELPHMVAAAAAWALYGAAKEWISATVRCPSKEAADTIARIVAPVLAPSPPAPAWGSAGTYSSLFPLCGIA